MRETARLDVTTAELHREPPSAVNGSVDRRARLAVDFGKLMFWIAVLAGLAMVVQIIAERGGWDPTGWQWPASWIGFFVGLPLAIGLHRWSERMRKTLGFPVPQELHDMASSAAEAVAQMHELLAMIDAHTKDPQWTKKMTQAVHRELGLFARQCEFAEQALRWRLPWMLSHHTRKAAKLAVPLHEATANVAKAVLEANPGEQ